MHTKGQWEADFHTDLPSEPGYWVVIGEMMTGVYGPVADTLNRHHCISPDEDRANAKLIAAAPDLLQAARDVVKENFDAPSGRMAKAKAWDALEAAIAKATP